MKVSKREAVLLTALLLMLIFGAYYMFFYMPNTEVIGELQKNINSTTTQIDNASITLLRRQALTVNRDALEEEFADVAKYLHEDVNDTDIFKRIESIIAPFTDIMNIEFAKKNTVTNKKAGLTSARTVHVDLYTTYSNLQGIIKAFEEEYIANRIIEFSCGGHYDEFSEIDDSKMRVSFSVEFLSR